MGIFEEICNGSSFEYHLGIEKTDVDYIKNRNDRGFL